ncbi:hypothetical protein RHECNPAF_1760063 [Rhizobium etli CNPAF512]|nr:hypothetical protein RHECNPAF_1760063 [Rhizobium etli CNPAF512]
MTLHLPPWCDLPANLLDHRRRQLVIVENIVFDRVETADRLQRVEGAAGRHERVDALQFGEDLFILEAGEEHGDRLAEHRRRVVLALGIDEDHLRDEVELAQGRRRTFRLKDVIFEKERHIIQEFQRDLAVDAQDGAVDEDSFSGFQRNA